MEPPKGCSGAGRARARRRPRGARWGGPGCAALSRQPPRQLVQRCSRPLPISGMSLQRLCAQPITAIPSLPPPSPLWGWIPAVRGTDTAVGTFHGSEGKRLVARLVAVIPSCCPSPGKTQHIPTRQKLGASLGSPGSETAAGEGTRTLCWDGRDATGCCVCGESWEYRPKGITGQRNHLCKYPP